MIYFVTYSILIGASAAVKRINKMLNMLFLVLKFLLKLCYNKTHSRISISNFVLFESPRFYPRFTNFHGGTWTHLLTEILWHDKYFRIVIIIIQIRAGQY